MFKLRWVRSGDGHEDNPHTYQLQYQVSPGEWEDIEVVNKFGNPINYDTGPNIEG